MNDAPALGRDSEQRGFALVAVIWSLGLIVLLSATVIIGAKYRTKVAAEDARAAATATAAESSINLAIAALLTAEKDVKFPLRCRMPGGELAVVTVEEEIGKIDLNTSSPAILERLFGGLTRDKAIGKRIAENIMKARSVPHDRATDPGRAMPDTNAKQHTSAPGFTSVMELDQIDGVSPALFREAIPFVTVRSGRTEPEREAASPVLLRFLGFETMTSSERKLAPQGNVTIRAEASGPDGSRHIREALISFGSGDGRPYSIREWRRGDPNSISPSTSGTGRDSDRLPSCVRI